MPAANMREMINANLLELLPEKQVGLSFSGGTDSTCLLFSLLELGYQPTLYTYTVAGNESEDLQRARRIPNALEDVVVDVRKMLRDGIRGKVGIQCMHGHYYVAPLVEQRWIVNGSGIDGIYGVYKTYYQKKALADPVKFNAMRAAHLADPNDDAMLYQTVLYGQFGIKVIYPYRQKNILDTLMDLTWQEMNQPVLKWITLQDYRAEFEALQGYYRPRGSQQIVAGTRELHARLLESPFNRNRRKQINDLYADLLAELGFAPTD
jgi:asparagine synthetase B (glutamine-hydrolysing)